MSGEHIIQQNIETPAPVEGVFTLPAGYIDKDGELHREVVLREMTGYEEDILASPGDVLGKMNEILGRCVTRIGSITDRAEIHKIVRELPVGDRVFLLIALRRVTLGDDYPFTFQCPDCGFTQEMNLDLSGLEVRSLENPTQRTKSVTLPSGRVAVFHIPTGKDEEKFKAPANDTSPVTRATLLRLDSIDGKPATLADVKALSWRDLRALRKEYENFDVGVDTTIEITCGGCGKELKTEMEIQPSFFFPSET